MKTTALIIEKVKVARTVLPAKESEKEEHFEPELELTAKIFLTKNLAERMNAPLKLNSGHFFREFGINE